MTKLVDASVPNGRQIFVHVDGSVQVCGVNFETNQLSVVARNEKTIVIKVPARLVWSGNYSSRDYASPRTMVYRIVKEEGVVLTVEPLIEWEHKRKKKPSLGRDSDAGILD